MKIHNEVNLIEREKEFRLKLIAGAILVLLGLFLETVMNLSQILTIIFVTTGAIIILFSALRQTAYGEPSNDERTRRLGSAAISFSWLLTFILVNVLFWIDHFKWVKMTVGQTIGIILFFMVLSGSILQWLYRKKGDID